MQNMKTVGILIVVLLLVVTTASSLYRVSETQQVVITQFGDPRRVVNGADSDKNDAGLHLKIPILEQVNYYEKRILEWDGNATEIQTSEKQLIWVDCFARWRIADPLLYRKVVGREELAHGNLDDVINGAVRNQIAKHALLEVVRTTNREMIIEGLEDVGVGEVPGVEGLEDAEADEVAKVEIGRDKIVDAVLAEVRPFAAEEYGIEIVDVRIKRINYVETVQDSVYERMIAERRQMAAKYRSQGEGEAMEIEGEKEREEKEILSDAYRQAEVIMGAADAKAIKTYAEAYSKDPEFYSFLQTLKSYEANLGKGSVLIMSSESDYLKYLKSWEEKEN
jgi:membrane protease subunit HflC